MPRGWLHALTAVPAREESGGVPSRAGRFASAGQAVVELEAVAERGSEVSWPPAGAVPGAARSLLFGVASAALLLSVAICNGYPTVYPDTGSYLFTGAFGKALFPFRSPGYGSFAMLTSLGRSLWFTAIAQAVIVVVCLYEACKYLIGGDSRFRDHCLVGIAAFLAAFSGLPWETSLIMPDVLAGVVFLSLFLLAFDARPSWLERILLATILAVGIGGHASLLPIAAISAVAIGMSRATGWAPRDSPSLKSALPWLVIPLLTAGLWNASLNRQMGLGFKLSPAGNDFLMGRLLNDGLAVDYLRANCPAKPFVACPYVDNLPKTPEQFLFWHPLLQQMDPDGNEVREIVRGTLAVYPLRFAWNSAKHTLRQFVQCRTGDEVRDLALHAVNGNGPVIAQIFPRDLAAYTGSKLIQGRLIGLTKIVSGIDLGVFALSAIACAYLAFSRGDQKWNWFFCSAVVFLFLNAAVCATFAGVYDRYQARVAWIMPLSLAIFACRRAADRQTD
jgi:hypothetical protein